MPLGTEAQTSPSTVLEGWYPLSVLGAIFRCSPRMMVYAAQRGRLGQPRLAGKRKLYSLSVAQRAYSDTVSPKRLKHAIAQVKSDQIIALAEALRRLRDFQWREANKNTVGLIEPPASEVEQHTSAEASV